MLTIPLSLKNFFTFCIIITLVTNCSSIKKIQTEFKETETGAREALQQEIEMTQDPAFGYVPTDRLITAKNYKDQLIKLQTNSVNATLIGVTWKALGPKNQGGRTRTMLIDANDPTGNTIFAASVGGGLWKTTNINATEPNWTPVNDLLGNLAVTSIAQDPSNPQNIYMATGEGYGNIDAIRGLGVWKSTDGGNTFSQLASTNNANFYYCQKVVVNSTGALFVSTRTAGLQRSADGGNSFTKVLGTGLGITGAASDFAYDSEIAADGNMYASLYGSIHKSTNAGVSFSAAQTLPNTYGRIELACAPSDANYVYAICANTVSNAVVSAVIITTDGGTNWRAKSITNISTTQAWYDLSIAVDPNNRLALYTGTLDLYRSLDSATTWTKLSLWNAATNATNYVHADQHYAFYKPGSSTDAYFTNDGGIFKTSNANASTPTFTDKGTNYNTVQFYACAMHPTALTNYFLAGAQDNGSHAFNSNIIANTVHVTGGDGAYCHIDQNEPQYQFTSYVYNQYYRSADGGASFSNVNYSSTTGRFINPTDYDNVNNIMYCANTTNDYLRWDNPQTGSTFAVVSVAFGGGQVSAVRVSPNTANRVFFGTGIGGAFRVDNANTATPTVTNISTGLPSGYLNCIEIETGNDNHLLACYTNYGVNSVWETTNGGTSWTSVEGNLPDMPIRWILLNPNNNTQAIVATELGVWSTDNLNGTSTVWGVSNNGLANVSVDMLQLRQSDKLVIAATHGRGLFLSDIFTTPIALFNSDKKVTYIGASINFYSSSYKATSWSWDFGDGSTSTIENTSHIYATAGKYNVTLTINAGASTITKNQYITILPNKNVPYLIVNGGNFEVNTNDFAADSITGTNWQLGNSTIVGKNGTHSGSNAWVTGLTAATYANLSETSLYTPNFNFSVIDYYALKFWAKFNSETGWDGFRVEYSTDLGNTWLPVGTSVITGWYNNANTLGSSAFTANQAFFSGSVANYTLYGYDVSFLAGNTNVAFRLHFKSDESTNAPGVAVDDVEVTGPGNTWNGSISNVWTNPANWDGYVLPGINSNVIIPSVAPNMPTLFSSATIKSIKLMPSSKVTVNTGFVLTLNGHN